MHSRRMYTMVQWGEACCGDPDKYPPVSPTGSWYFHQLQASVPRERLGAHRSHHYFSWILNLTPAFETAVGL